MRSVFIPLLLILCGCLFSCQDKMYRKVIPTTPRQIKTNPYGAYTELTSTNEQLKVGEALAISGDTLYLLGEVAVIKVPIGDIQQAKLILTRNRANRYLTSTALLTVPSLLGMMVHSDYSGEFAIVGLAVLGSGGLASAVESGRKGEIKTFPGDISDISELTTYCRFPRGIPPELDIDSLKGHLYRAN